MKKEIIDELKEIGPSLSKIGNRNPFVVPEGYFEYMELSSLTSGDERLPDGYFDNLSDEILLKVESPTPVKIRTLNIRRWIAAASVALLCIASYLVIDSSSDADKSEAFALDIELEEAFDYLAEQDNNYLSDVIDFEQFELLEETEFSEELDDSEIDLLLDEVTLDDLDGLL